MFILSGLGNGST
jgi:2-hydroxycyclohexanecarboxyl-CoA dehydrogenase